ncbi:MAG: ABC transporter ATP-binding protein [Ferrovum sp. 37-45-19]|uniref:ABC transporter ATP-binding protein n=1 Tax=Ferrovum sp. JA12 TaxID=1356299 RepID=UPI000702BFC6|nr:ABC transporter ATP-binding protein [Ferrovum sp. JA12]OYV80453.1 MAG: ABC transporter ATP-binding protein [Ferrovum sp. 21-44-67]OYV94768.1 MAG: ABC transporter ATP-binding protein [Ferrovum sp. 37-45-19]OZB31908.1 MAG: ABC transporter ATP-binding protein [Ferrovum sp. 34-44-207]HQT81112.1 ABC transporter ATP-binding protein [Ferrovaceae bacterium]KRH79162.1 lipopolysaccharide export system ATP-binding protein LptB [Ferrovum sp. JA12]
MSNLLEVRHITKGFGGLLALKDVNMAIPKGSIVGLIGPNGAGKTTLFNIITGLYRPDQGDILLANRPLPVGQAHEVARCGIARTFQNIRLFGNLTVLENILVGRHLRSQASVWGAIFNTRQTRHEERAMRESAHCFLDYVGLSERAWDYAKTLSYGDQRRLEIARALATEPTLLALDEPAAGMNLRERQELATLIQRVKEQGITVLVIEHDVKWIMSLCQHISVLNFGEVIAEGDPYTIQHHPKVIEAYLGRGQHHAA